MILLFEISVGLITSYINSSELLTKYIKNETSFVSEISYLSPWSTSTGLGSDENTN
jgi:hypothetical protein